MTEFICRLGTPSGEVVTRIVEAAGAAEARDRLENEGFRVFAVSSSEEGLSAVLSLGGGKKGKVKQSDFLLFNQQFSALLRAGIPVLQAVGLLKTRSASANLRAILGAERSRRGRILPRIRRAYGPLIPETPPAPPTRRGPA